MTSMVYIIDHLLALLAVEMHWHDLQLHAQEKKRHDIKVVCGELW